MSVCGIKETLQAAWQHEAIPQMKLFKLEMCRFRKKSSMQSVHNQTSSIFLTGNHCSAKFWGNSNAGKTTDYGITKARDNQLNLSANSVS